MPQRRGDRNIAESIKLFREESKTQKEVGIMKKKILMNLQLFAEPNPTPEDTTKEDIPNPNPEDASNGNNPEDQTGKDDKSIAEQLAELRVQNAKLKKATDKATSEAATFKKQLREKQSAEEIALQEKAEKEAEREEAYQKLLKENTVTKYEKSFLALGYSEELASKAACAQFDGDTDELFKIQQNFQATLLKQKEAEWAKSRPTPQAGNGEGEVEDAFLKGFES